MSLLLLGLMVWRVSALLVCDRGPRDIFVRLRELSDAIGGPLSCFWCTSGWVSLVASVVFLSGWKDRVMYWWASWAVAVLVDEMRLNWFPPGEDVCDDGEKE